MQNDHADNDNEQRSGGFDAPSLVAKARAIAAGGDAAEALQTLVPAFMADSAHEPAYVLARDVLTSLGAAEEAALFAAAATAMSEPAPFRALGEHFSRQQHAALALAFYSRANALDPDDPDTAYQLSCALCDRFQPSKAYDVQCAAEPDDFFQRFQMYWAAFLAERDLDHVERFIAAHQRFIDDETLPEETRKSVATVLGKLSDGLDRLRAVGTPQRHIRDWQFIQYGGAVLLPFDDGEDVHVAGGRWVFVQPSVEMIATTLSRLQRLLRAIGRRPTAVTWVGNRDGEILAHAAARLFELPLAGPASEVAGRAHTLVVGASAADFTYAAFGMTAADQTTFAFDLPFLERAAVTPDVVGMLSQTCILPWSGGGLRLDPETNEVRTIDADPRAVAEIASEIVAAVPQDDTGFDSPLTFYVRHAERLVGSRGGVERQIFLVDSPLPASLFGA